MKIIAEEQAGFRVGRSTTEQIFNLRLLCEKYSEHQQDLYHVFIDFKKAFDSIEHVDALRYWQQQGCLQTVSQHIYEPRSPSKISLYSMYASSKQRIA